MIVRLVSDYISARDSAYDAFVAARTAQEYRQVARRLIVLLSMRGVGADYRVITNGIAVALSNADSLS